MGRHWEALLILALAALPELTGCKKKIEERPAAGVQAPATAPAEPGSVAVAQVERTVLDDRVREHWAAVELTLREKQPEGGSKTVVVAIGDEATVPGTKLQVRVLSFVPDFAMSTESITTKSMQDANPAVKLQVREGERVLFQGWSFKNFPEMHSFEDPRYTLHLTRAVAAGKER